MPLKDQDAARLYSNNLATEGGHYLLGANRHWHGGMHFTIDKPVQAVAAGKLIAYRFASDYITADLRYSGRNPKNKYSNSFALIQHEIKVKDRILNCYSLYMHLMPASGYNAKPSMAIPDYIRATEGSERDATITTSEDVPGGLNIRHLKTGEIIVTAPVGSELLEDNDSHSDTEQMMYLDKVASNANYKKVTFIDHKGESYSGYALLDSERTLDKGGCYVITTQEDPLMPSDENALKGLNLRTEKNFDVDTIRAVLKKNSKVKLKVNDTQWAEVIEIDGIAADEASYIYYNSNVKFDENDIDEGLLDSIHCPNTFIETGTFLGHPGLNFSQDNCLHFEIFSDDTIVDFIKEHADLEESDKTILKVNKGSKLFHRIKENVPNGDNLKQYTFQEKPLLGSSDECYIDLKACNTCKDTAGNTWYEVTLPFDDKGFLHYLSLINGVNRTATENGWVKENDTELTSPLNWPGFKLAKEEGTGSQDAEIDYKNLTPFFKELFEDIDVSGNGEISGREVKAALKDDVLSDRLSRVIAKHPSEWQNDVSLSKWQHLKDLVPDDAAFEEAKEQIKNLSWWDEAKTAGADLPASSKVYHFHPISFIEQLDKLPLNIELVITRFAQWPKNPEALNGIEAVPYAEEVPPSDNKYNDYLAYMEYFHALNASQGGTHSKFKFIVNGSVKMTGYMLEAAGPNSQAAGSDQRIMPGNYSLIDNPGSKGDFRLVKTTKEAAAELFGNRSLVNIHIGNFPKDIEGCFAPGIKDLTMNKDKDTEYPYVISSTTQYNRLKDLIIEHTSQRTIPSYDGSDDEYNDILYTGLTVIIKEEF